MCLLPCPAVAVSEALFPCIQCSGGIQRCVWVAPAGVGSAGLDSPALMPPPLPPRYTAGGSPAPAAGACCHALIVLCQARPLPTIPLWYHTKFRKDSTALLASAWLSSPTLQHFHGDAGCSKRRARLSVPGFAASLHPHPPHISPSMWKSSNGQVMVKYCRPSSWQGVGRWWCCIGAAVWRCPALVGPSLQLSFWQFVSNAQQV